MFWLHLPEDDTAHKRPVCVCVCTLLDAPWQSINDMNLYKQAMFFAYSKWVRTKDDPVSCVSMEGPSVYMLLPSLLLPLFTCPFHLRPKLRRRMLRCDSLWLSLRPVYGAPPAALSIQLVHLSLSHWGPAALATHTNEPDWRTFVKRKGVIWEIKKKKKGEITTYPHYAVLAPQARRAGPWPSWAPRSLSQPGLHGRTLTRRWWWANGDGGCGVQLHIGHSRLACAGWNPRCLPGGKPVHTGHTLGHQCWRS